MIIQLAGHGWRPEETRRLPASDYWLVLAGLLQTNSPSESDSDMSAAQLDDLIARAPRG